MKIMIILMVRMEVETSEYVETVIETMKNEHIGSVLKHFPGMGIIVIHILELHMILGHMKIL